MRSDPLLKLVCGALPESGEDLASQPTICRMENAVSARACYRIAEALARVYIDQRAKDGAAPQKVLLDFDATDDPTHGDQEESYYHGYFGEHIYHPLLVFDGDTGQLITALERRLEEEWEGPPGWRLQALGEWLADIYPWESVGDAVVFVVSGRPPQLAEPLSAAIDIHKATYSITFSRWVSEETVVRAYRKTQHDRYRLPQAKTVRVLRFVSEQADIEGVLPSWQTLYDRWNAANPDMRYASRDGLFRAYKSAVNLLVPPYLPLT